MTSRQLRSSKMAVVMEGPLSKWTNVVKGWQYRWFVLDDNTGLLSYYTSKEKMMRGARRGCLRLKGANLGIDDEDDSTFTISCDQKTFHFQARDAEEREQWIRGLEDTIKRHSQVRKRPVVGRDFEHFDPTRESLDQRLAEAEAYYKILTNQIKLIKNQMNADLDCQGSQRYAILKESSENMLESIGKCLELMYIAKRECEKCIPQVPKDALPLLDMVNDHYSEGSVKSTTEEQKPQDLSVSPKVPSERPIVDITPDRRTIRPSKSESSLSLEKQSPPTGSADDAEIKLSRVMSKSSFELTTPTTEVTSLNFETLTTSPEYSNPRTNITTSQTGSFSSQVSYAISSPAISDATVPYASYSSSDEEDVEFFDANEFSESSSEKKDETSLQKPATLQVANLDDEDEYEPTDEDVYGKELGADAIEQHGSVITHLLSQVRLGMDLTKVVLPTFILETRSLLEMYADFFSHPDLFVGIVDKKTPEERIIQVLRWYLSAMSAGRKGSVAKKPYNPILGETFRCFWALPEYAATRDKTPVKDGPVPWASKDDVTFLAEQVSHHPPISAFYAENRSKMITFGAHIWTKSKFLGLSIGVENVGQGCVSVIPYDEEYVLTFPNGYGRSILTVPWIEIGGKGTITCAKTGYNATVQFHCKPFYGGKKHRVTGEVMAPNEKKPFLTINGEWNALMYAKYADKEEEELFIDAKHFPTHRKLVKKVEKQGEFESKRLWKDVTFNLKNNNVEKATEGKHKLEERQRAEARERKENGTQWETKLFHEIGGHWLYDRPYQKILSEETERKSTVSNREFNREL